MGQVQLEEDPDARPDLKLWGLTLGMTLDLLSSMSLPLSTKPNSPPAVTTIPPIVFADTQGTHTAAVASVMSPLAPSMSSIFPRFTHPDINALIWIFGWRYRRLLSHSKHARSVAAIAGGGDGTRDVRVNWAGMALGSYYSAVRRALVVAVFLRAMTALAVGAVGIGWVSQKLKEQRLAKRILA